MDLISNLLIGVGLAMDAFTVSLCSGMACQRGRLGLAVRLGLAFGGFQILMPVLGWLAGSSLHAFISGVDHWIAFAILAVIGGKMIYEASKPAECREPVNPADLRVLLMLAIATSIDALAVGVSFAFFSFSIVTPVLIIGAVTFCLSALAVFIGNRVGALFGNRVEVLGGLVLIGIGARILLQDLGLLDKLAGLF